MKINEVEAAVGVTKKNIRFYEEEGLITPSREPGNGYRSYSQADVERLRRIKLLRKLDVPLAEIREMLEGRKTLAEGMALQLERLSTRRKDLNEAIGFCEMLEKDTVSLNELDVEQTLARLAAREEQGVTFVNIERTDRKAERIKGALVGAGLFTALMAFIIATMAWAFYTDPQGAPPLPLVIVLLGIPAGCIVGTLKVLLDRIEEIGKGEEDAYRNY
ncbi:MerR family transcriptional regulator [Faecalibacterium langellae]|uniref:MerR family transcriptional regulator n=1 Tax=Faecalibacterium langellae TaxID=3435293 RepID=A0ACC9D037_9FIRM|nr:MerR family transcriptional regulator [Faecalibacterium prausnitzii]PDX61365.1 MerR family transcriptional regulator [Faecalibacterium prausnitzii]